MESNRSFRVVVTMALCAMCVTFAAGCTDGTEDTVDRGPGDTAALPQWTFDSSMLFPGDGSLARPEDGVALPDGRLIVGDQVHGLRLVELDGSSAPFGEMAAAGYVHNPPERSGGPNGVSLEPDGAHLLVADIFNGGIYRVEVATGATERVYQHRYGVNTAVRDSRGAIWFTQSAQNTPEAGEARMWATVDIPRPEGALLRLAMDGDRFATEAEVLVDSLYFANGVVIDEASGHLYVAETMGGRVLRYRVDLDAGQLSDRSVFVDGVEPDNLELDGEGHLWIALPLANGLLAVDTETGARHLAFSSVTPAQQEVIEEFVRRGQSGTPRLELLTPALWDPLPAFVTGVIVGPGDGPVYLTGLGDALVRLPAASELDAERLQEFGVRYTAAWSSHDAAAVASFFGEGGSLQVNDDAPAVGREAIAAIAQSFMDAFPDFVLEMDSLRMQAGAVEYHWTFAGTNTGPGGSGKAVRFSGHEEWTIGADGLVAESKGHFDEAEYARQLESGVGGS
jgi:sugar lactone lactonase YvrE/predicted ester cyclase